MSILCINLFKFNFVKGFNQLNRIGRVYIFETLLYHRLTQNNKKREKIKVNFKLRLLHHANDVNMTK